MKCLPNASIKIAIRGNLCYCETIYIDLYIKAK